MYTINWLQYYIELAFTWISQYVLYLYNTFRDFSPVIKIAAISLTFSIGLIIFTVLKIIFRGIKQRKWAKQYAKFERRYGDGIRYLLSEEAGDRMSRQNVIDALDLEDDDKVRRGTLLKNFREKLSFARLVYNCRISDEASLWGRKNLHVLLDIFNLPMFLEDLINKGKMRYKSEALTMIRAFKLPVNQWIANTLRTSKRFRVRRLAMYASIMSSSNSDLEYFESEFFDENCCIYDEIQLGYVLQRRISMRRQLPNLAQLAKRQKNQSTQAVFVKLMRLFNQEEYCSDLEELFETSTDKKLTTEICRTWGYLKYYDGEEKMQEILMIQPDDIKVTIMHALTRLRTGKSLGMLVDGYRNNGDQSVRFEALRCLYNYGPEGYAKFKELEVKAPAIDKRLFDFFNNPITLPETKLESDDTFETKGGDNLFSVV